MINDKNNTCNCTNNLYLLGSSRYKNRTWNDAPNISEGVTDTLLCSLMLTCPEVAVSTAVTEIGLLLFGCSLTANVSPDFIVIWPDFTGRPVETTTSPAKLLTSKNTT